MHKHKSHIIKSSFDSSWYDEKCINCGATDISGGGWGKLAEPCPNNTKEIVEEENDKRNSI